MPVWAAIIARRLAVTLGLVVPLALLAPALAYDEVSPSAVNVDAAGVALRGHDPVAYFTDGQPVRGVPLHSAEHEEATYRFATAANRDAFLASPEDYLPAYGGFCAMGVAMALKLDGDPDLWRIVDGKLYLNVDAEAQRYWQADIPGNIAQADENWPRIKDVAPRDL